MKGKPGNGARLEPALLQGNYDPGGRNDSGGSKCYMLLGCLIRHSTQRLGKPATWGRT